jgi:hypothetical protein
MRNFFFQVKPQDFRAAIRVALSVGLPLYATYLFGRLDIAVFGAFGALTSLYGHSEPALRRLETQVAAGVGLVTTIAVAAVFAAVHGSEWLLALLLFAVVLLAGTLGAVMKWVPRGEIFFILSLLVVAALPLRPEELPLAVGTSLASAALSILLTRIEINRAEEAKPLAERLRQRTTAGSEELDRLRHVIAILAAALGVLLAWLLARALQVGHPFWAPLTVAALIPALVSPDALRRTIHLALGTCGGVAIAALLYSASPAPLALISIIVGCQAIAEVFVARSYAVALLFFTPLAIGMSNMSRGLAWTPILAERVTEAGLGTAVALATILVGRSVLVRLAPLAPALAEFITPVRLD